MSDYKTMPLSFSYFLISPQNYQGYEVLCPRELYPDTDIKEYTTLIKQYLIKKKFISQLYYGKIDSKTIIDKIEKDVSIKSIIKTISYRFDEREANSSREYMEARNEFLQKRTIILHFIEKQYREYCNKFIRD